MPGTSMQDCACSLEESKDYYSTSYCLNSTRSANAYLGSKSILIVKSLLLDHNQALVMRVKLVKGCSAVLLALLEKVLLLQLRMELFE